MPLGNIAGARHPLYPDSVYYGNNTATANLLPYGIRHRAPLRGEVARQVVAKCHHPKQWPCAMWRNRYLYGC